MKIRSKTRFSYKKLGRPKIEGYVRYKDRVSTIAQNHAFIMCIRSEGRIRRRRGKNAGGDNEVIELVVHRYIEEPAERYELDGNKIIRTVSAFHYISDHTKINGLCRSFMKLNRNTVFTGKEKPKGVGPDVIKEFKKRYFFGSLKSYTSENSDLDRQIRWHRVVINKNPYFIIQMKNIADDNWTYSQLFASSTSTLNSYLPLKLSQEEIIDKLKKGEIDKITKLGNPEIQYTKDEVLQLLGIN